MPSFARQPNRTSRAYFNRYALFRLYHFTNGRYVLYVRRQAKHKTASPLIVETAEEEGGLYDSYRTLDALQSWRRPQD